MVMIMIHIHIDDHNNSAQLVSCRWWGETMITILRWWCDTTMIIIFLDNDLHAQLPAGLVPLVGRGGAVDRVAQEEQQLPGLLCLPCFLWLHRRRCLRHCSHYQQQSNQNQRCASKAKASWGANIRLLSCCQRCPSAMWEVRLRSLFWFHDSTVCVHPFSGPYQDPYPFVLIVFSLLVIEVFPNIGCHLHLMIKDSSTRPSRTSSPWATSPQGQARHWTLLVWPGDQHN